MDEQDGVNLTPSGLKKLGNLVNLKDNIIADAIRERGGGQGQVNQLQSDYQNMKVGELANLAAEGDEEAETAIKVLKQERNVKNMAIDEFPIGQTLTAVSIVEDKEFAGNQVCFDQVKLLFQNTTITLLPIADTDEIEIIQESSNTPSVVETPYWCKSFIGKKLMTIWVCENDQGYRDQLIFAFEYLRPSIAFVAEGSIIKAFRYEQIYKIKASETGFQEWNDPEEDIYNTANPKC